MALPLKGLRVIDLTKDFAGPFCTMILSDLGAEVIKIEKPIVGDETRTWGPPFVDGLSYYFHSLNRGKKSVALDLKQREAQNVIRRLVQDSDILVESFRPGVLAKYKIDYNRLRQINKALVYCSITGFGQTGPYRNRPAYDLTAFAMSGIMSTTGEEDRPPIRVGIPVADIAAGHYASTAIVACLSRRLINGQGEYIDIALQDSITSWLTYLASYYFAAGKQPKKMGSAHPSIVPYQVFMCSDKPLALAVGNDDQWTNLCHVLKIDSLSDPRFASNPLRVRHRKELIPLIQKCLKERRASDWTRLLSQNKVPASTVYTISDVVQDPQIRHRRLFDHSNPRIPMLMSPFKFAHDEKHNGSPAPRLGQDTKKVLRGIGYSNKIVSRLAQADRQVLRQ